MLEGKTGALYEFAAQAGAMIGLETDDSNHPLVQALTRFSTKCGIAFQLQDDILGIIGDEALLGKPVGSDIREGKRTTIVYHAYQKANAAQKQDLLRVLGNPSATQEQIRETVALLKSLGGIERTKDLAKAMIQQAVTCLRPVPASEYKQLLLSWARYMIQRDF